MLAVVVLALLMGPVTGSLIVKSEPIGWESIDAEGFQWMPSGFSTTVPEQTSPAWVDDETPWWERTALDQNRNGVHDSLETFEGITGIGLSYSVEVNDAHLTELEALDLSVVDVIESVNGVLLGQVNASLVQVLADLTDVVMVERYGNIYEDLKRELDVLETAERKGLKDRLGLLANRKEMLRLERMLIGKSQYYSKQLKVLTEN